MSDFAQIRFQPNRPLLRELSADRLNTILQEIKRNKPKAERGITVRQDGTGTYIGLAASLARGGAPTARQPWDLISSADPNNPSQYLVTVKPGTLNGFLPTNWDQEFQVPATNLQYAKAVVSTDGRSITSVAIAINNNAPTLQSPVEFGVASSVEYLFGLFLEGSVYRVIGNGHIVISPKLWLTTERASAPAAGDLPFLQFFTLR